MSRPSAGVIGSGVSGITAAYVLQRRYDVTGEDGVGRAAGRTVFGATLEGERRPATTTELLRCLLRYPGGGFRVPALIRYQGIKLFLRRLPLVSRPPHTPQEDVQ